MGPNGSGKTTLAYALMGHPAYVITGGEVTWKGHNLLKLSRPTSGPGWGCSSPSSTRPRSPACRSRASSAQRLNAKLQGLVPNPTSIRPTP